mmetsp:Transcript_1563/g.2246  ORF Transcript_1563/g.2246 Transcript_1563/m.2246 type:complete len:91 (-) Transcript_1563:347-619(-)
MFLTYVPKSRFPWKKKLHVASKDQALTTKVTCQSLADIPSMEKAERWRRDDVIQCFFAFIFSLASHPYLHHLKSAKKIKRKKSSFEPSYS